MKFDLLVFSTETLDSHPAVGLSFFDKLYIFNIPDQTQRVFFETKLRFVKINHVFLTTLKARSIGGFHGLTITAYDSKNTTLTYSGLPGFKDILESYSHLHTNEKLRPQYVEDFSDNNITVKNIYLSESVAYDVKLPDVPGKFLADKAKALGLSPGPIYKDLANGKTVKNSEGVEITPDMVLGPATPSDRLLVVDCQSFEDIAKLPDNLAEYNFILHFTKIDLLLTPEYLSHFDPGSQKCLCFPPSGKITFQSVANLYTASSSFAKSLLTPIVSYEDKIEYISSLDDIDKDKKDITYVPKDYVIAVPAMEYAFAPPDKKRFVYPQEHYQNEQGKQPPKKKKTSQLENLVISQNETQYTCSEQSAVLPKFDSFAVTFLGTGAMYPSKYRDVTGILLHTDSGFIAIDPGEGFAGQLRRRYGRKNFETIMKNLIFVWVSHLHGDHHFGLYQLLQERAEIDNITSVPLLCHSIIKNHMEVLQSAAGPLKFTFYPQMSGKYEAKSLKRLNASTMTCDTKQHQTSEENNENSTADKEQCLLKPFTRGNVSILSIPVCHCVDSLGCLVTLDGGWRIAFSGDRTNTDKFTEIAGSCDLLIHEASFTDDLISTAREKRHSTIGQALETGKEMNAKYIILTHFSQRYPKLPVFSNDIFENVAFAFDYLSTTYENMHALCSVCPQIFQMIQDLEAKEEAEKTV